MIQRCQTNEGESMVHYDAWLRNMIKQLGYEVSKTMKTNWLITRLRNVIWAHIMTTNPKKNATIQIQREMVIDTQQKKIQKE